MQRAQRRGGLLLRVLPLLLLLPATGCKRSLVVVLPAQGTASPLLSSPSGNASALCIAAGSHWCGSPSESHCSSDCTLARFGLLPPGAPSKSWRCYSPKCFNGSGAFNHRAPGCNICTSLLAQFMAKCKLHPPPPPPPPLPPPSGNASAICIAAGSHWCGSPSTLSLICVHVWRRWHWEDSPRLQPASFSRGAISMWQCGDSSTSGDMRQWLRWIGGNMSSKLSQLQKVKIKTDDDEPEMSLPT